jgi:hypothetical protein
VEEERTGHSATSCNQLPIPTIGVRSGESAGVCHRYLSIGHGADQCGAERAQRHTRLQRHAGAKPRRRCATDREGTVRTTKTAGGTARRSDHRDDRRGYQDQDQSSFGKFLLNRSATALPATMKREFQ